MSKIDDNTTQRLLESLHEAIDTVKILGDFEEGTQSYVRFNAGSWHGQQKWTTWKVFLDESKSKIACRDARGFHVKNKHDAPQIVIAPKSVRNLLLAKSKADRDVAHSILNGIAEKNEQDRK